MYTDETITSLVTIGNVLYRIEYKNCIRVFYIEVLIVNKDGTYTATGYRLNPDSMNNIIRELHTLINPELEMIIGNTIVDFINIDDKQIGKFYFDCKFARENGVINNVFSVVTFSSDLGKLEDPLSDAIEKYIYTELSSLQLVDGPYVRNMIKTSKFTWENRDELCNLCHKLYQDYIDNWMSNKVKRFKKDNN